MLKLFIPTDRIGLESFQKSISGTAATINGLLRQGVTVGWHTAPLRLDATPLWPEGHLYQCGFAVDDTEKLRTLLAEGEIVFEPTSQLPPADYLLRPIKIAVYDGRGAGRDFSDPLVEVLSWGGFLYDYIGDSQIRSGQLMDYDVLVVPGSPDAGECYYAGLGDLGQERIRQFIATRGQYLGICGGAYLPLSAYNERNNTWLTIVEATEMDDLDYWHTGSGLVRCRIDDNGHPIFSGITAGVTTSINITYWEGPAIELRGANVKQLAHFEQLLASGRDPLKPCWEFQDNTMVADAVKTWHNPLSQQIFDRLLLNRCAIAEADYHGHKIIMCSPHPEMGNIGYGPRKDSLNFLILFNSLFYLSAQ